MKTTFIDTGAWIALVKRDDQLHIPARLEYQRLSASGVGLVTTNYIIDESATRLRYDAGLIAALDFRARLLALQTVGRLSVVWINERLESQGWQIMEQYGDLQLSLTDATSAAVARAIGITDVFGFDRHFQALGFTVFPVTR